MSNPEVPKANGEATPTAPPSADFEKQTLAGSGVSAITRRWKTEDWLKRGCLTLRGLGLLFSFLAFVIMASNKHGAGRNFDEYEEYRYVLAIAILSTLYTGGQSSRHVHEMSTERQMMKPQTYAMVDFLGDQIIAYFLLSAASSAIPLTNRMREADDYRIAEYLSLERSINIFIDSSASAISMQLLAFLTLGLSALISGFKLANQFYI